MLVMSITSPYFPVDNSLKRDVKYSHTIGLVSLFDGKMECSDINYRVIKLRRCKCMEERKVDKKGLGLMFELLSIVLVPVIFVGAFCILSLRNVGNRTSTRVMTHELKAMEYSVEASLNLRDQGDYSIKDGELYKGEFNLSRNTQIFDELTRETSVDISIYYGDTAMYSTIDEVNKLNDTAYTAVKSDNVFFMSSVKLGGRDYSAWYAPLKNSDGSIVGAVCIAIDSEVATSAYRNIIKYNIVFMVVLLIIIIVVAALLIIRILKGIKTAIGNLDEVAEGNLAVLIPEKLLNQKNEIGNIARSVHSLLDGLTTIVHGIHNSTAELNSFSEKFKGNFDTITSSIANIDTAIDEIANGATNQANETQKVSGQVEHMGKAIDYMSDTISTLAGSAETMKSKNEDAESNLDALVEISNKTKASVDEIQKQTIETNRSALDIRSATEMIADIASQTNLLSLNASIEAARAGENGRGFAVVADEIRVLADQSTESAEKIKSIIEKLIENSNTSVQTMNSVVDEIKRQNDKIDDTKSVFGVLKTEVDSVTAAIENLAEKVEDINGLKNSVTESVESLAAIAQENAAGTEETSASMVELSQIVNDCNQNTSKLVGLSQELQDDIGKFKLKGQLDNIQ